MRKLQFIIDFCKNYPRKFFFRININWGSILLSGILLNSNPIKAHCVAVYTALFVQKAMETSLKSNILMSLSIGSSRFDLLHLSS